MPMASMSSSINSSINSMPKGSISSHAHGQHQLPPPSMPASAPMPKPSISSMPMGSISSHAHSQHQLPCPCQHRPPHAQASSLKFYVGMELMLGIRMEPMLPWTAVGMELMPAWACPWQALAPALPPASAPWPWAASAPMPIASISSHAHASIDPPMPKLAH